MTEKLLLLSRDPFAVVLFVFESGNYELVRADECGRFVESCALALDAWDRGGMWGHLKRDEGGYQGHAIDQVQSLAGRAVGLWRIVSLPATIDAAPTFDLIGQPQHDRWFHAERD